MTKILSSNATIKNGALITVSNTNRKSFSNEKINYTAIWLQDSTGKNDKCYLFTGKEIIKIISRIKTTSLDLIPGRLNIIQTIKGNIKYIVKLINGKNEFIYGIITEKELLNASTRAQKNPEDLTQKSLFRSIIQ